MPQADESPTPEEAADTFRTRERQTGAALLLAERLMLRGTKEATARVVDGLVAAAATTATVSEEARRRETMRQIRLAVPSLTLSMTDAIRAGRQEARDRAGAVTVKQLRRDVDFDPDEALGDVEDGSEDDDAAAALAAQSFASRWGIVALVGLRRWSAKPALSLPTALARTELIVQPQLKLISVTESAAAFNSEQRFTSEAVVARAVEREESPEGAWWKFWSALLDGHQCPTCNGLHGTAAHVGKIFITIDGEVFEDPPAHPRCRCTAPVMWLGSTAANDVTSLIGRK